MSADENSAPLRLDSLYQISKILCGFESVGKTIPEILAVVAKSIRLESAVLVVELTSKPNIIVWHADGIQDERLTAARISAQNFYATFSGSAEKLKVANESAPVSSVAELGSATRDAEAKSSYIVLPLAVGRRPVFGVLQLESINVFHESDLKFINTLVNQLAIVLDLKEIDRRKDEFLAMLAHELRNPLAPIKNAAHVLRTLKTDNPTILRTAEIIQNQGNHLAKLVDDLLDVSRIQTGKIVLQKEPMDLGRALSHAAESCEQMIESHGHCVTCDIQKNPPLLIIADPTRIDQIFVNLIKNAVKYTPSNGSLHFKASHELGFVVVRIRDNGVGLEARMLTRIFEVFTQVDQSIERSDGGLGIGLKLVKELVELHGGTVSAHSEGLGKGCEFVVKFPIPRSDSRMISAIKAPEPELKHKRILVVDDNADIRETMELVLTMSGHSVELAEDGPQGIQKIRENKPDVALIDIGLPTINGYELAREVRLTLGDDKIVLIAVSGYGQSEDKRKAVMAGFNAHLTKPVDPDALIKILATV